MSGWQTLQTVFCVVLYNTLAVLYNTVVVLRNNSTFYVALHCCFWTLWFSVRCFNCAQHLTFILCLTLLFLVFCFTVLLSCCILNYCYCVLLCSTVVVLYPKYSYSVVLYKSVVILDPTGFHSCYCVLIYSVIVQTF